MEWIFVDATSDNSIKELQFLEGLDLGAIMPQINKYYMVKKGFETYPRRDMVKALICRIIKKLKYYTQTEGILRVIQMKEWMLYSRFFAS